MKKILLITVCLVFTCYFLINVEKIILTHFGTKQWDLFKSDYKYKFSSFNPKEGFKKIGVYEFSWNGRCNYYLHNKKMNKLFKYQADDIIVSNKWKYVNDSIFEINEAEYKILYFKKDSIVLLWNNPEWLDTLILIPSPTRIEIGKNYGGVDSPR